MTGTKRGLESTPLVIDGVLYATGSWSRVYALDAASGRELWRFDPEVPGWKGRNVCCDVVNRGVAAWKGRIYLGTIDGRLIALDAATGKPDWEVQTTDPGQPYSITGAPRVVKGRVIIGNGGADLGVRSSGLYPDLRNSSRAVHDSWNEIVLGGSLQAGGMASFADHLTGKQAQQIHAYVLARSHHEPGLLERAARWIGRYACIPVAWAAD